MQFSLRDHEDFTRYDAIAFFVYKNIVMVFDRHVIFQSHMPVRRESRCWVIVPDTNSSSGIEIYQFATGFLQVKSVYVRIDITTEVSFFKVDLSVAAGIIYPPF